jgi:hypothetical protein
MYIFYRISDNGYKKIKPPFINNENCLKNFIKVFSKYLDNLMIIADNMSDNSLSMLYKYIEKDHIINVSIGHGAGTFNIALDKALELPDNEIVYFVENDYLHKDNADIILYDGFHIGSDFITLYDHPDKYLDPSLGGNAFCYGGAENTRIYLGKYAHWKLTNSTTMTFASKVQTLKKTKNIIKKWTSGEHPHDFNMFIELLQNKYSLISCIPGYATHGETQWLCPLVDWNQVL